VFSFPSVQCGEPDAEHIGDLHIGHAAFTALVGDYSHYTILRPPPRLPRPRLLPSGAPLFLLSGNEFPDWSMKETLHGDAPTVATETDARNCGFPIRQTKTKQDARDAKRISGCA
jgi:hypothetical protein